MTWRPTSSWGGYPDLGIMQTTPSANIRSGSFPNTHWLPRGAGRSYGDVCLNEGGVLVTTTDMCGIERVNSDTGRVIVKAGSTIGDVQHHTIPMGWHVPVVPGTQKVTLGGAVANDVHGKNHHRVGTFGRHIVALEICRSDGTTSWHSHANGQELFTATIGGLGLTGLITRVEMQLSRLPSSVVKFRSTKTIHLRETMEVLKEADHRSPFTVAWVDLLSGQPTTGRGLVLEGTFSDDEAIRKPPSQSSSWGWLPGVGRWLLTPATVRMAHAAKYYRQRDRVKEGTTSYRSFFHPLDGMAHWNRAYGPSGFLQYQFAVPEDAGYSAIHAVTARLRAAGLYPYLSVLKRFGDLASPGILSFPCAGWTLAIDLPNTGRILEQTLQGVCDDIVRDHGGRVYPAKDAVMTSATFQAMYPQWTELERYRDPMISSSFWRRVTTGNA